MLSRIPFDLARIDKENIKKEILRTGIIAELDAINLYEQMASIAQDQNIKKVLLDIAREEKTHVGEFEILLLRLDDEQKKEIEEAKSEIKDLTGIEESITRY